MRAAPALLPLALLLLAAPASLGRPREHPSFRLGMEAFAAESWAEAADRFLAASREWSDDGVKTRVSDRWFEPYAPSFFLGRALAELGCRDEALAHLQSSILCARPLPGRRAELAACQALMDALRQPVTPARPPATDCARWGRR